MNDPNGAAAGVGVNAENNTGGFAALPWNRVRNPLDTIRSRLFHALFFKASMTYARNVPKPVRRIFEWFLLLQAIFGFLMLMYIHITFSQSTATCLDNVKNDWPRNGVLRVSVGAPGGPSTSSKNVYANEDEEAILRRLYKEGLINFEFRRRSEVKTSPPKNEVYTFKPKLKSDTDARHLNESLAVVDKPKFSLINSTKSFFMTFWRPPVRREESVTIKFYHFCVAIYNYVFNHSQLYVDQDNQTNYLNVTLDKYTQIKFSEIDEDTEEPEFPKLKEEYVMEYSLEYGYLRLSTAARTRLRIPVKSIVLDPETNKCFGDEFSRFILREILGYDDLLMASVKVLAEEEDNKGYLRNVATGEHYRFISIWWMTRGCYALSFVVMVLFTLSISMLLRYSHHQIFVFIVDLLQMLEFNATVRFPAAPLLIVILALVGIEVIMSEFFNDTTTAFYIILTVWLADQYDAICCYTGITKRHWLKFFYLYHFSFYAYHYRFNGQYSIVALLTSWLFIQHSMVYFFHHYELPVVIQQAHIQQIMTRAARATIRNNNEQNTGENQETEQNDLSSPPTQNQTQSNQQPLQSEQPQSEQQPQGPPQPRQQPEGRRPFINMSELMPLLNAARRRRPPPLIQPHHLRQGLPRQQRDELRINVTAAVRRGISVRVPVNLRTIPGNADSNNNNNVTLPNSPESIENTPNMTSVTSNTTPQPTVRALLRSMVNIRNTNTIENQMNRSYLWIICEAVLLLMLSVLRFVANLLLSDSLREIEVDSITVSNSHVQTMGNNNNNNNNNITENIAEQPSQSGPSTSVQFPTMDDLLSLLPTPESAAGYPPEIINRFNSAIREHLPAIYSITTTATPQPAATIPTVISNAIIINNSTDNLPLIGENNLNDEITSENGLLVDRIDMLNMCETDNGGRGIADGTDNIMIAHNVGTMENNIYSNNNLDNINNENNTNNINSDNNIIENTSDVNNSNNNNNTIEDIPSVNYSNETSIF